MELIALKAAMAFPSLMLQKPHPKSKGDIEALMVAPYNTSLLEEPL